MSITLIILVSFLASTSLAITVVLLTLAVQSSPQSRIRRRLLAVARNQQGLRREARILLKDSVYSSIPGVHRFLSQSSLARNLDLLLDRANLDISVGTFLLLSLFTAVAAFTVLSFNQPTILALLGGALTSAGPYLYVRYLARARMRRFLEQMPDGLDIMAQGLQAGLGLSQAQGYLAKEMSDPIGTEFSVFMEELNLGLPIPEALKNFQQRVPLHEMRLFSTALSTQREVGGSLAELLNKLADVIRDRFRIEREIRVLTAQNRLAAIVVCSLPPAVFAFMCFMDPKLMREVWESHVGWTMLVIALVLEIFGIIVFRRLLRLHI
jgi:tight adherence protein B